MERTIEFLLKRAGDDKWDVTAVVKDADAVPVAPLIEAKVTIIDFGSKLTERDGICIFTGVPSGPHQVSAEKEGYIRQTKPLVLEEQIVLSSLQISPSVVELGKAVNITARATNEGDSIASREITCLVEAT